MNSTLITIGNISIKWYSLFIAIAFITAGIIIRKEALKKGMDKEEIIDMLFYGLIFGIIGARTYYILFNLNYYLSSPIEMLKIWNGGLAIHGGIIATLLFLVIYTKKKKINLLLLLDIIVVGLIIAQAIGRWGNFFNSEAYGRIVDRSVLESLCIPKFIIEGMYINGYYREPTFFFESISSVIGFIVLIVIRKKIKINTGLLTSIYLLWYGVTRLFIEGMRADSLMLGPLKIAQVVSIIYIIIGLIIVYKQRKNKKYSKDKLLLK